VTSDPVAGVGVHSGRPVRVVLHRATGALRFRTPAGEVPARVEAVVATDRSTVLGAGAARVATVEHVLAALRVAGFWSGVLVELDAEELPILDGSASAWCAAIDALGAPPPAPPPLVPDRTWTWRDGASEVRVVPGAARLEVAIDFPAPIGSQGWAGGPERFADVLSARTFAFADDLAALRERGLVRGASEGSGILFTREGPHVPLRFADEPARHKALDALGDLALIGRPMAAAVHVRHGSHRAHVTAMQQLLATLPPDAAVHP
jgi:UDP-3-O-[3-hydroxymyristoyl] N-acetylglucosamine deacetylase